MGGWGENCWPNESRTQKFSAPLCELDFNPTKGNEVVNALCPNKNQPDEIRHVDLRRRSEQSRRGRGFTHCQIQRNPNEFLDPLYDPTDTTHYVNDNGPIRSYQTSETGRIEWLEANVTVDHLDTGTPTTQASRDYLRRYGGLIEGLDHAGHIVANTLGGDGRATYNLFSQNGSINSGAWRTYEQEIREYLVRRGAGSWVRLEYEFYYCQDSNRPVSFTLRAEFSDGDVRETITNNPDYSL